MKSIYILCWLVCALAYLGCKNEGAKATTEAAPAQTQENAPATATTGASEQMKTDTTLGHDYTFLTDKLFIYKNSFGGNKDAKEQPYKNEWIDLMPDGKFKAGKLKEQTHTGTWAYDHKTKTLVIRPDNAKWKASEWKVMFNDQMMVWVGTQTYGDNNIQLQLIRSTELP